MQTTSAMRTATRAALALALLVPGVVRAEPRRDVFRLGGALGVETGSRVYVGLFVQARPAPWFAFHAELGRLTPVNHGGAVRSAGVGVILQLTKLGTARPYVRLGVGSDSETDCGHSRKRVDGALGVEASEGSASMGVELRLTRRWAGGSDCLSSDDMDSPPPDPENAAMIRVSLARQF